MTTSIVIGGNEFVKQISTNLLYLKSYNYDLFSFYPTNRTPTHWGKILESIEIQDLTDRQPILVYKDPNSEKLYISDGQNRFLACKKSKRPIYAIVVVGEDLNKGELSLSILNSYQKNWSTDDYLEFYAAKKYKSYEIMLEARKKTGLTVTALVCIAGEASSGKPKFFKTGKLKVRENLVQNAMIVKKCYDSILKNKLSIYGNMGQKYIINTIYAFLRSGAKSKTFIEQLAKYGYLIEPCGTHSQYFAMWVKVYNYKKHSSTRIIFITPTSNGKTSWNIR